MRSKTKNRSGSHRPIVEPLESRVLYSADPFGLGIDTPGSFEIVADILPDDIPAEADPAATEVFIVDEYVPNFRQLIDDLGTRGTDNQSVQIYTIGSHQSLSAVSDILSRHSGLNTVHFITHGYDANLRVGSSTLSNSTIGDFEKDLRIWGESISEFGDLLIYGCNFAETAEGQALAQRIAALTSAEVAASEDLTGHSSLGGDWALEYTTGDVESESLLLSDGVEEWEAVLATITVTTETDEVNASDLSTFTSLMAAPGGDGISLREAIIVANANPDLDTIILPVISDGKYDLDLDAATVGNTDDQYSGDLDVWNSIVLQGAGIGDVTIDAKNNDRVFSFSGGTSTIENVKIQNGETTEPGGGILVKDTTLTLNYVDLHNNQSLDNQGGGIYLDGSAVTVNINDSLLRKNIAGANIPTGQAGGAIHNWAGTVNIERTEINENEGNYGAAIFNHGLLNLKDSWFHLNKAIDRGGAIHNEGTAFIDRTLFEKNEANGGGAISNTGYALIENSTFSENKANNHGGAILNTTDGSGSTGVTEIFSSTLAYNIADSFAAIDRDSGTVNLQSSIIDQSNTNSGVDINNTVTSLGFNIANTTIPNALDTDTENTDPHIENSLSDEGGFSRVYALKNISPAINGGAAIDPSDYTSAQDGTGAARNEIPDTGAFEYRQSVTSGEIFWTNVTENAIYRGNTEGTLAQEIIPNRPLELRDIEVDILNGRIYWLETDEWSPISLTSTDLGSLYSAKLDGSDIQALKTDLLDPKGIALDVENERIFVTNNSTGINGAVNNSVEIVNYGSTPASPPVLPKVIEGNSTDSPPQKMETPTDVEYDPLTDTVIWTDTGIGNGGIQSITGSGAVNTVLTDNSGVFRPTGLSINPDSNTIYWSNFSDTIFKSDIDGSNADTINASGSPTILGLQYHKESDTIFAVDSDAFSGKILAIQADKSGTAEVYGGIDGTLALTVASLSAVNEGASVELNTGVTVPEGTVTSISDVHLNAIDPNTGSDFITYTLTTTFPSEGELWLKGVREITSASPNFKQSDIDTGLLEYRHLGSEIAADQFRFTVTDGSKTSSLKTFDITITAVNDAPAIASLETATLNFTENTPVNLSSSISVTDVDDTQLESAVIKIVNAYNSGEDQLSFTNTATITGNWNAGTGELTLTGTDTLANYEDAIKNVSYTNSNDNPDTTTRSYSVYVNDGGLDSVAQSRDISITATNDAPAVTSLENISLNYTENTPVNLSNTIAVNDVDDTQLESALIKIDNAYNSGEDLLLFTNTATITGSWNGGSGELTLSGTESLANYNDAIKNVSYTNSSDDPDTTIRRFSVSVNDGELDSIAQSRDISITATNDAPVITSLEAAPLNYTENTPVSLSTNIAVTDIDDTQLDSAVIKIVNAYKSGEDLLLFTDTATITSSWNAGSGELTLSGTDTLANYEIAIKNINYTNNSDDPDTTPRSFSVLVNDGELNSIALSRDISITATNDAPTITAIENTALSYTDGDGKITLSSTLLLDDIDSATISSATVQISGGYNSLEDTLALTSTGSISASWNPATGTLSLSSTSPESIAVYQAALRNVTYENNSSVPDTTARTVEFIANDGTLDSLVSSRSISLSTTNSAPVITISGNVDYLENDPLEPLAPTATISDPDSPDLDGGILKISLSTGATTADRLVILSEGNGIGQVNVSGTSVYYEGVQHGTITSGITGQAPLAVTLNALATSQSAQAILRNISYINLSNSPEPSVNFEINLTDGDGANGTVTGTINITARNDAPVVSNLDGTAILAINDGSVFMLDASSTAVTSDADFPVDFDGGNLTVTTLGFGSGDNLTLVTTGSFTLSAGFTDGSVVSESGIAIGTLKDTTVTSFAIDFNNNATPDTVDKIVHALQFSSTDTNFGLRSIDLSLTDGDGTVNGGSDTSTANINIYLSQAALQSISVTEDTPYPFDSSNFDFTGTTGGQLETITITSLPANGVLQLGGSNIPLNTQITKTQIDSGALTFTPAADANGSSYASFDFYVNSGNKTVQVLAGNYSYYTLDALHHQAASILSNASNFGPSGTISTDVSIQNATAIVDADYLSQGKVLFSGYLPDGSLNATELAAIDTWVKDGGILISTGDLSSHDDLNSYYGLDINNGGSYLWNIDDTSNSIINGPFGLVSDFWGHGNGGFFDEADLLSSDIVLARDSSNLKPTMILRELGGGHILFTADEGVFRTNMTGDGSVSTSNDILTANTYAWAIDSAAPSDFHTVSFDVTPENDSSIVTLPDSPSYGENAGAELIMPTATVTDIDSIDFDAGTIDITLTTDASVLDLLKISNTGNISSDTATGTIYYSGTAVGTFSGGELSMPLTIHLNANADTVSAQAILRSISFESTDDNPGTSRTFDLDFTDGDGGASTLTRTLAITPVNDDPVNSGSIPATSTVTEDSTSNIDLSLINLNDADSLNTDSLKLLLAAGGNSILNASAASGITISGNDTNSLVISGTLADLNAYLNDSANITYEHNIAHTYGIGADSISVSINDNGNMGSGGGTDVLLGDTSIDISPVNDDPKNNGSLPSELTVTEDTNSSIDLSSVTISDKDDGSSILTATLKTSTGGMLTAASATGILINGGGTTINIDGTRTKLNQYFNNTSNISYQHSTAHLSGNSADTITLSVNDNGNFGAGGGTDIDFGTINIHIDEVNDDPDNSGSLPTEISGTEDSSTTVDLSLLNLSDVDDQGLPLKVTINSTTGGHLSAVTSSGITLTGSGTALLSIEGALTDLNNYLNTVTNITYIHPTANINGASVDTLDLTVSDNGNTGTGGGSAISLGSVNVNISAINDNPDNTGALPTTIVVTEDTASPIDLSLIDINDPDHLNGAVTVTLNTTSGSQLVASSSAGLSSATLGSALSLTGTITDLNTYFDTPSNLTYLHNSPNTNGNNIDTLSIAVNDNGNTGSGGGSDIDLGSIPIDINAVNDPPTLTTDSNNLDYTENDGNVPVSGNLVLSDIDTSHLTSATVSITNNFMQSEDALIFVDNTNITGNWDATTGTLVLTGTATISHYQAALSSVSYLNSSESPSVLPRTVTFNLTDGTDTVSAARIIDVFAINDNPIATGIESTPLQYTENDGAVDITNSIVLGDADDTLLESATVLFSSGFQVSEETLFFSDTTNIIGTWNQLSGTLTLTGTDTIANYQSAIRSISYQNNSEHPATETTNVSISVNDGLSDSATLNRTIETTRLNDAPNIASTSLPPVDEDEASPTAHNIGILLNPLFTDYDSSDTLSGVAIINNSATVEGAWEYATDSLTWYPVGTASDSSALLLDSATWIRFKPAANYEGTPPAVQLRAIDSSFTESYTNGSSHSSADTQTNGGTTAFSATVSTLTTIVTAINDAPFGTDNVITQPEDQPYQYQTNDFGFSDPIENHSFDHIVVNSLPTEGTLTLDGTAVTETQLISVSLINAGLLKYTAPTNANGSVDTQWDFAVADSGGTSNLGQNTAIASNTIRVELTPVNDAPQGQDNTVTTTEDTPFTFSTTDFGFTDVIDSHSLHTISITSQPSTGKLLLDGIQISSTTTALASDIALGKLTWEPGSDTHSSPYTDFNFKVIDDGGTVNGGTDTALNENTITIDVLPVNDPPAAQDNTLFALEDINYVFNTSDFGFTDSKDSNSLEAVKIDSLPGAGSLTLFGTAVSKDDQISASDISAGGLIFLSAPSSNGTNYAQIDFRVTDDGGSSHNGINTSLTTNTLTFNVLAVNDEPIGLNSTITAIEDTPYIILAENFGFIDSLDGNALSQVMITSTPASGDLMYNGSLAVPGEIVTVNEITNGTLTYAPAPSVNGFAVSTFDFRVIDNGGVANGGVDTASAEATVTIDITAVNDPPMGSNTTLTATEDTPYLLTGAVFGFSDTDIGDTLSAVVIESVSGNGTLTAAGVAVSAGQTINRTVIDSGELFFEPLANSHGSGDSQIEFRVVDSGSPDLGLNTAVLPATIIFDVTPVNDIPSSIEVSNLEITENTEGAIVGDLSVTDNDTDDSHTLSVDDTRFEIIDGQLSLKPDVFIDFEVEPEIPLAITAIDENNEPYTQLVNLIIKDTNDAPVPQSTPETQTAIPPFSFVLPAQTFIDEDGDQLTYSATLDNGDPLPGWLVFDPDSLEFTVGVPDLPTSSVNVLVTAQDDSGLSATTSIQIALEPIFAPALPPEPTIDIETEESEPEPATEAEPENKETTPSLTENPALPALPDSQQQQKPSADDLELPQPLEIPQPKYTVLGIELIQAKKHVPVAKTADALFIEINASVQQQQIRENLITEVALNKLANQMDDSKQLLRESVTEKTKVLGTSVTMASSLSVGYIFWILRSGTLLASILTSLPAWKFIDPLPVLNTFTGDDDDNDKETLESMVEENPEPDDGEKENKEKAA